MLSRTTSKTGKYYAENSLCSPHKSRSNLAIHQTLKNTKEHWRDQSAGAAGSYKGTLVTTLKEWDGIYKTSTTSSSTSKSKRDLNSYGVKSRQMVYSPNLLRDSTLLDHPIASRSMSKQSYKPSRIKTINDLKNGKQSPIKYIERASNPNQLTAPRNKPCDCKDKNPRMQRSSSLHSVKRSRD